MMPVRDGNEALRTALRALTASDDSPEEILVVVDGPSDASSADDAAVARAHGAAVVTLPERCGPARARNHGARLVTSEVVLFVDADVAVHANAVGLVRAAFRDDPALGAVFGSYDAAPAEPNFCSQFRNLLHHHVHQTAPRRAITFWAGCGAVRRTLFLAAGGFAERYTAPSIEDIELGGRLATAGHRIELRADIQATHLKRWTAATLLATDLWRRAVPWTRLVLEHRHLPDALNLRTAERWSALLSASAVAAAVGAAFQPALLAIALACLLVLAVVHRRLYALFRRRRGWRFAAAAAGMHVVYYLNALLGFAVGAVTFALARRRGASTVPP